MFSFANRLLVVIAAQLVLAPLTSGAQVTVTPVRGKKQVDVRIGGKPFTSLLYPDSLEKPVLYPVFTSAGKDVTRGFPMNPKPGDPNDHPHHVGIWLNYESVNGLDFWNNSYAIPADKKSHYGRIITGKILRAESGKTGTLAYSAGWVNEQREQLLEETTTFVFSTSGTTRVIDRTTVLKAMVPVHFADVKDGMLGIRLAHALQMPSAADEKFSDNLGNVTVVKAGADKIPAGNYLTSAGKTGHAAWGTRASWCKAYGKMGEDWVSVVIIDHPQNPNYPTFWHARGYGLFAANPLGENVFTNGKSEKNLKLQAGESVTFRYRILVDDAAEPLGTVKIKALEAIFSR